MYKSTYGSCVKLYKTIMRVKNIALRTAYFFILTMRTVYWNILAAPTYKADQKYILLHAHTHSLLQTLVFLFV